MKIVDCVKTFRARGHKLNGIGREPEHFARNRVQGVHTAVFGKDVDRGVGNDWPAVDWGAGGKSPDFVEVLSIEGDDVAALGADADGVAEKRRSGADTFGNDD